MTCVSSLTVSFPVTWLFGRLRLLAVLLACCAAFWAAAPVEAQVSADSDKLLHRMYASPDFEVKYFGPARWLDSGAFYTTLESSSKVKEAQDIVRYETATGKREILVSAAKLIPPGSATALAIENYAWSNDKSRLLIFTNSKQVWRRNTRGDYWVVEPNSGTLRKLPPLR